MLTEYLDYIQEQPYNDYTIKFQNKTIPIRNVNIDKSKSKQVLKEINNNYKYCITEVNNEIKKRNLDPNINIDNITIYGPTRIKCHIWFSYKNNKNIGILAESFHPNYKDWDVYILSESEIIKQKIKKV